MVLDPKASGVKAMDMSKTIYCSLEESHIGHDLVNKLWERLEKQIVDHCWRTKSVFCGNSGCRGALAFLVKN